MTPMIEEAHGILAARLQVEGIRCVYISKPGDAGDILMGIRYDRWTSTFKTSDYERSPNPIEDLVRPAIEAIIDGIIEGGYQILRMRKIIGEREWLERDGVVLNMYRDKERIMLEVLIG